MHYYKFNIAGWSLSTAHLTLEEEAIYFRLVNYYYDTEKPIPLVTHSVFRRLRMETQTETALAILGEFFELTDNGWFHSCCEKNLKEYRKTTKKNKANGAKGGRPRKDAASRETQSVSSGLPSESQKNPNYKLITNNQELITNNQLKDNGAKAPKKKFDAIAFGDQFEKLNHEAWQAWVEKRKSMKKPISETAAKQQIKKLVNHNFNEQSLIINQSIENDYQGLFPLKNTATQNREVKLEQLTDEEFIDGLDPEIARKLFEQPPSDQDGVETIGARECGRVLAGIPQAVAKRDD